MEFPTQAEHQVQFGKLKELFSDCRSPESIGLLLSTAISIALVRLETPFLVNNEKPELSDKQKLLTMSIVRASYDTGINSADVLREQLVTAINEDRANDIVAQALATARKQSA
ncbi:hypothetical protein [Shewanella gaetbuli]|uniref:Uncharacterized protein n=1 Tax=Shewanella gaetbuli TaxID=220752 RepID=A0A9X1ZL51_9GAMM|nr:hypothetical protein [Shewanella gaetbuli]MCL1142962.1 hypothetical protein [Shewanella gaetbuli]